MPQKPVGGKFPYCFLDVLIHSLESRVSARSITPKRSWIASCDLIMRGKRSPRRSAPVQNARPDPVNNPTKISGLLFLQFPMSVVWNGVQFFGSSGVTSRMDGVGNENEQMVVSGGGEYIFQQS
jgi:hypothetical protein